MLADKRGQLPGKAVVWQPPPQYEGYAGSNAFHFLAAVSFDLPKPDSILSVDNEQREETL